MPPTQPPAPLLPIFDNKGQAFARNWCQTYDSDRATFAPIYEYYCGVPSMQMLLVVLTVPEEELFPDADDD